MAHYAKVVNNVVEQVIVAEQDFIDSGAVGLPELWVLTSYNSNIRNIYAGIGSTYNSTDDVFIPLKPHQSWVLNETTYRWESPKPKPMDTLPYLWDEVNGAWEVQTPMPNNNRKKPF